MIKIEIQNVSFDEQGIELAYYLPEVDVKAPGYARMHTLIIALGGDHDDEIAAVVDAAKALAADVLDSFEALPAFVPPPAEEL